MGAPLKNPPLIEVICEFRFDQNQSWHWTIPTRLYERIGQEFSEDVEPKISKLEIISPERLPPDLANAGLQKVQLRRPDKSAMVQIGPHLLVINHLRPYPSWKNFKELILKVHREHASVWEAGKIARIGIRYINRIPLQEERNKISDYLSLAPPLSGALDRPVASFYQRYELNYDTPRGLLIHQTGTIEANQNKMFMLDLDFVTTELTDVRSLQDIAVYLDQAHNLIEDSFIASLNPLLYQNLKDG